MSEAHLDELARLEQLCFADPWSVTSIETELTSRLSLWFVAMEGDTVVGYVGSQTVLPETDMMNVAVSPDRRREGIAEHLINALVTQLRGIGSTSLALEVRASNLPAIRLYEKFGFLEVGRRKNYYRNPREDALILRKEWEI